MYILLPDSIDGLDNLVDQINPVVLGDSIKSMESYMVKVVLPKFNFEYTSILGPILQMVSCLFEYLISLFLLLYVLLCTCLC